MNTCDPAQVWTTSHCQNQDHPTLTVQNLTFVTADRPESETMDGGGAILVRGGRFKVVNTRFFAQPCAPTGPDVGGAAIQVFRQYQGRPVFVVNSDVRRAGRAGQRVLERRRDQQHRRLAGRSSTACSRYNRAIGNGANPPSPGTPGGGSGGAIYNDGNLMTLRVAGHPDRGQPLNGEGGSAIFFVSNDRSGDVEIVEIGHPGQHRRRLRDPPEHLLPRLSHHVRQLDRPVASGAWLPPPRR